MILRHIAHVRLLAPHSRSVISKPDANGMPPLAYAIIHNDANLCTLLMVNGANVNGSVVAYSLSHSFEVKLIFHCDITCIMYGYVTNRCEL